MLKDLEARFRQVAPAADFCSMRFSRWCSEDVSVRQLVPNPVHRSENAGAMITVHHGGGLGYAATSDLTASGLKQAADRAKAWAKRSAGACVIDFRKVNMPNNTGEYRGPNDQPWESMSLADKFELLLSLSKQLKANDKIVDWSTGLWHHDVESLYLTAAGGRVYQQIHMVGPKMRATASSGGQSQSRNLGGFNYAQQGGLEVIDRYHMRQAAPRIAQEAIDLLAAPNCPAGTMDVLLSPDQMILQIHESIGHPLELDRILGDERNYAGTSFVTLDMLGSFRYGSDLLNITFDPTLPQQLASYGYDDEGAKAQKQYLIKGGILQRALGATVSQARTGLPGVSDARGDTWNRPPIDRMANLNLEPGTTGFDEMLASVARGVYMQTVNCWSIDDSRNKFQFGCEWGRLIEDGKLTTLVRNPNYRGISATFWRSLKAVGTPDTVEVMGTPNCGKGEPNQSQIVGHSSPACLFENVDVFGGV